MYESLFTLNFKIIITSLGYAVEGLFLNRNLFHSTAENTFKLVSLNLLLSVHVWKFLIEMVKGKDIFSQFSSNSSIYSLFMRRLVADNRSKLKSTFIKNHFLVLSDYLRFYFTPWLSIQLLSSNILLAYKANIAFVIYLYTP